MRMHADMARATKFNVSLPFLLQQAAWLYEHQLLQVREQIMKVGVSIPPSASPGPGSTSELAGGEMMRRTGSGGGREPEPTRLMIARSNHPTDPAGTRALSSLSARRDSPIPKEPVLKATPRPTYSPRSSVTLHPQQPYPNARTPSQTETRQARRDSIQTSPPSSPSSNSGSSSPSPPAPSRLSRRPPKFPSHKDKRNLLDEDDEDDEPAFMPLASTGNDLSAPSQDDPTKAARKPIRGRGEVSQTSDSSTSSVNPTMTRRADGQRRGGPGPLSPKRTAELSGRKDGSDGTPSMGSSFSDLDGVSQLLLSVVFAFPFSNMSFFEIREKK
jgi:hypothetical protein